MLSRGLTPARTGRLVQGDHALTNVYATDVQTNGTGFALDSEWDEFRPDGYNFPVGTNRSGGSATLGGDWRPQYLLLPRRFNNLCGVPTADNSAGGRRTRVWVHPDVGVPLMDVDQLYHGDSDYAEWSAMAMINSIRCASMRNGGAGTVDGSIEWRALQHERNVLFPGSGAQSEIQNVRINATGGTLTYAGQTTSALTSASTASAVQTALEALSNLAPGDVTVTGGNGNYNVAFGGTLANVAVAEMTGTGGVLVTTTQQGNAAASGSAPTSLAGPYVAANHFRLYLAEDFTALDAIDMTDLPDAQGIGGPPELLRALGHEFAMGDLWNPVFEELGLQTATNFVSGAMTTTANVTLPRDTASAASLHALETGCTVGTMALRIAAECDDYGWWTDMMVTRNADADPSNDNDLFLVTFPLIRVSAAQSLRFTQFQPV